ncbi:hypothetical protein HC928_15260 [bacterium]|nr:hypothetical protein [bacterium]
MTPPGAGWPASGSARATPAPRPPQSWLDLIGYQAAPPPPLDDPWS